MEASYNANKETMGTDIWELPMENLLTNCNSIHYIIGEKKELTIFGMTPQDLWIPMGGGILDPPSIS